MKSFLVIILVLAFAAVVQCGKVLVLCPLASPSHRNVMEGIYSGLAERGHEIVIITSGNPTPLQKNVREITFGTVDWFRDMTTWEIRQGGVLGMILADFSVFLEQCHKVYSNPEVQKVMNETFDLVMYDGLGTACLFGLVHKARAPIITVSPCAATNAIVSAVGNHLPPSFVHDFSSPYSGDMNFWERTLNVFYGFMTNVLFSRNQAEFERIYRQYVGTDAPDAEEIAANASLVFVNAHLSFDSPKPLLPNVIDIGGAHCRPGKPLTKKLDDFVSGAKDGLILFSLGSIVKPHEMPDEIRQTFVNVFSRLKQRVLWKWPLEMQDLPPNIMLTKWVPQQDVLAHPNTKLFITHGGLLSTQEAIYHQVPTIYFPIVADEDNNAQRAKRLGTGKALEILTVTESELEGAIREILGNRSYHEKIQQLSKIFHDQPQTPKERAAFWAEYVMRHKGALHLQSAARKLNFFQYHSIDSVVFIAVVFSVTMWLLLAVVLKTLMAGFSFKRLTKLKDD